LTFAATTIADDAPSRAKVEYIVGPVYDALLFLSPPTVALGLGIWLASTSWDDTPISFSGYASTLGEFLIGAFIHAHLFLVFFRSHGNAHIRRRFPVRFFVVPVALYLGIVFSPWVAVTTSVLATFWDVYHSGAQTFGLCRLYERAAGNPASEGRSLDFWMNQLLYAGPILGGATLLDHLEDLHEFEGVGTTFFSAVPARAAEHQQWLLVGVLAVGVALSTYYVGRAWQLARAGHRVSVPKVVLLTTTGLCSIFTWGFNTFGEAFFIMNFFHALQYFGIVWATEGKSLQKRLGSRPGGLRTALALGVFVGSAAVYGAWAEWLPGVHALYAVTLVVSILHFWYDGFIWSVRRQDVRIAG
jgi:hypothetical protein